MQINMLIPYVFIKLLKREESKKALIEIFNSILNFKEKINDIELIYNKKFNKCLVNESNRIDTICYFSNGVNKYITIQILNSRLTLDNTLKFFEKNKFKYINNSNYKSKSICITFIKTNFLSGKRYHSIYELEHKSYNTIDEFHFIEFNKFNKSNRELLDIDSIANMDSLTKWLIFLKYNYSYLSRILENYNDNMRNLKTYSYELKLRSSFKNTYELFEKAMYDEISAMESSKEEGLKEGKEERLEEWKKEVAKNLLYANIEIEIISKSIGLTEEEIIKIKEEL